MTKDEKVYEEFNISLSITDNARNVLRTKIVDTFMKEKGGYWKDGVKHVTRYRYYVETLRDGRRIYLYRPTFLNKGIDFQVTVERYKDGEDARPSHDDITADLNKKKKSKPKNYQKVIEAIKRVWDCEEPDSVLKDYRGVDFGSGFSLELLLKALKWLFIEQDVTYWNYDGRGMLLKALKEV